MVELRKHDPQPQTLSLAAGLALIEAVDSTGIDQALMLKWPNDLLLNEKKLAGILLERSGNRVVIGFGVNLESAPELPDRPGASLSGRITPQDFAPALADRFARLLGLWRTSEPALLAQAWLARAHPIGTRLAVHSSATETISGRFDGIEPDGSLLLRLENGSVEIVRAGDISLS